jgi:predicted nucleic acid-binding Zn ribbon protein
VPKGPYRIVRVVAVLLRRGEPTAFRFEASARYGLRVALVLAGHSWPISDATAAYVVKRALRLIGARRPLWYEGQREYTDETATKIGRDRCVTCGRQLPQGREKYCSKKCGNAFRAAIVDLDKREAERARKRAHWDAIRAASERRQCERCGAEFKPVGAQRFCSRSCSGRRSVAEKMNGKKHPWLTPTGDDGANNVERFSASTRTATNASARSAAKTGFTTASLPTHEPRRELR